MARAESVAIGGYYPFPQGLIAALAALVRCDARSGTQHAIADPCAGDGEAILGLMRAWFPAPAPSPVRVGVRTGAVLAVAEVEETRAARLRLAMQGGRLQAAGIAPVYARGDAFALRLGVEPTFGVVYLNPPYDTLPGGARLEALFLDRFLPTLVEGGILLAVLPASALVGCAVSLAATGGEALALRFPDPQWGDFGQVVVLARARARGDLVPVEERRLYREVLAWAAAPEALPVLGVAAVAPWLAPPAPGPRRGQWDVAPLDVAGMRALLRPGWRGRSAERRSPSRGLGLDHGVVDLGTPPV